MRTTKTLDTVKKPQTSKLTAQEIKFAKLTAQGYSLTKAYKLAFPAKADLQPETIRNYASELMRKSEVSQEVATTVQRQALLARLAEERIEETLTSGKLGSKAVTDTSMFVYDHANGKAKQSMDITSRKVEVHLDLTGVEAPLDGEVVS
jgi:hypothetical protein